jgi:hypothetical protein
MAASRGKIATFRMRRVVLMPAFAVTALLMAACSGGGTEADGSGEPFASSTSPEPSSSAGSGAPAGETTTSSSGSQEDGMNIQISINGQRFQATLRDSAAARDLVAQLPATIDMRDHGGVEKTGRLPSPLALNGQPEGADPDVGDVGYYAPGNDFVLYYGDQSYFPGIVVLGRLSGDAAARIAELDGSVTAVIESGQS